MHSKFFIIFLIYSLFSTAAYAADLSLPKNIPDKKALLQLLPNDHFLGQKDAKIVIIEYSSLACPHCAEFHTKILKKLKENYIDSGLALYIHRHFPTNKPSLIASMLTVCSNRYFEFLEALFISQESWAFINNFEGALRNIAKLSGMESNDFNQCINNKILQDETYSQAYIASKALDLYATPVLFINDERIDGVIDYESLAAKIEKKMKL